ncbi:MAG: SIS domain-containing protein [Spirochaetales bacterium]|nr:SIS domain-containing protein [Spirochaetales bacterium]
MNNTDAKYTRFALCKEMLETPDVMRNFNAESVAPLAALVKDASKIMLTGEGSSRIFPAKRAIVEALRQGLTAPVTEGATQAMEYRLSDYGILGASNSGRTRELVRLFRKLREEGHKQLAGLCAHPNTPLEEASDAYMVLGCGNEEAVAATKSVAEQAMAWQTLFASLNGQELPPVEQGAAAVQQALTVDVPEEFSSAMANARTIFFAGRNDGVAEELTLKTNEIVRKTSDFLEGTYVAHGIEEIMREDDVIILVNPFPEEEEKIRECVAQGVGAKVFAIASRDTLFPTLRVPEAGEWNEYVLLAAGWNLLVEAGIAAGIDLDKPERARKVGNEVD